MNIPRLLLLPLLMAALIPVSGCVAADPAWSVANVLQQVPPLKHDVSGRLPIITWPPFTLGPQDKSFADKKPLPGEVYRELARRGLTQRLPMDAGYIPMAQAIQAAGGKIVLMEGAGGVGPFTLGPDPFHKLPADYKRAKDEPIHPCPILFEGWAKRADQVRETLRQFKAAGVEVTAAWLDWEVEPWGWPDAYEQTKVCSRCRASMPKGALLTFDDYRRHIAAIRSDIFSAYLAAPLREIYPACSTTDWSAVYSSPERPSASCWANRQFPPRTIGLFTGTNPVAYGNDIFYQYHWKKEWNWPLDEAHMDRLYTAIMLAQVSHNAENQQRWAPERQCLPWVCRYCPDVDDDKIPILSRERYREILRHIWLRGADSMQIFNEPRPKHPAIAVEEVADVIQVYDEMLEYRSFLDDGVIMNTTAPTATDDGAIWSGLRLENEAVVRAFTMGDKAVRFSLTAWPDGAPAELEAPPQGRTYRLTRGRAGEAPSVR